MKGKPSSVVKFGGEQLEALCASNSERGCSARDARTFHWTQGQTYVPQGKIWKADKLAQPLSDAEIHYTCCVHFVVNLYRWKTPRKPHRSFTLLSPQVTRIERNRCSVWGLLRWRYAQCCRISRFRRIQPIMIIM